MSFETTPLDEVREKPVAISYRPHKFCPNCIIVTDISLNSTGPVIRIVPCAKHGEGA